MAGRLRVRTEESTKAATSVTFGPGPFTVTLEPTPGGWTIDSILQGAFTAT